MARTRLLATYDEIGLEISRREGGLETVRREVGPDPVMRELDRESARRGRPGAGTVWDNQLRRRF